MESSSSAGRPNQGHHGYYAWGKGQEAMQLHEEGDQDQEASHSSCLGSRHLIRLCWWERTPSCLPCILCSWKHTVLNTPHAVVDKGAAAGLGPQWALWMCPQLSLQTQDKISTALAGQRVGLNISGSFSLFPEESRLVMTATVFINFTLVAQS